MRSQYNDDDADGQRLLATWCERNGLKDQAKAHWSSVAELNPDSQEAHQALGHVEIAGVWYTKAEIAAARHCKPGN